MAENYIPPKYEKKNKITKNSRRWLGRNQSTAMSISERFFEKIEKKSDCWLWMGAINSSGYGSMICFGKAITASRLSWELHFGKIPEGKFICHKCDVRRCVNPEHLFLGDNKINNADKKRKNRAKGLKGEKNCKAKLTPELAAEIVDLPRGQSRYLAEKFGVHRTTIQRIQRKSTWTHL